MTKSELKSYPDLKFGPICAWRTSSQSQVSGINISKYLVPTFAFTNSFVLYWYNRLIHCWHSKTKERSKGGRKAILLKTTYMQAHDHPISVVQSCCSFPVIFCTGKLTFYTITSPSVKLKQSSTHCFQGFL